MKGQISGNGWIVIRKIFLIGLIPAIATFWALSANEEVSETGSWRISEAEFSGKTADISEHTTNARTAVFKPDGSRMYVVGRGTRNIVEYKFSEPWKIDTAEFVNQIQIPAAVAHGLFFNDKNGTDMYVLNRREIIQFKLSVPWDISTAEPVKVKRLRSENVELRRGHDIHFKPDGTRFYVEDRVNQEVYEYHLSVPWDVEAMEWANTLDISDEQLAVRGIDLSPDGTRMWLCDTGRGQILEYDLETQWKVDSAEFQRALTVSGHAVNPRGFVWRPDGRAFYVTSTRFQAIYEYKIEED